METELTELKGLNEHGDILLYTVVLSITISVYCVCMLPNSLCVQWQKVYDKGRALYASHSTRLSHDNILSMCLMDHLIDASNHLCLWEESLKYSIQLLEPSLLVIIIQLFLNTHTHPTHTQPSLWAPSSFECIPATDNWRVETMFRNY